MTPIEAIHDSSVKKRRVKVLSGMLLQLLPESGRILDIGSGDGEMAAELMRQRPGLEIHGIDTLVRPDTVIPTTAFDGLHIDEADASYDWCLFVDVLHHASDPEGLLREAARVSRKGVIVKDHLRDGVGARETLCFMDRVHNSRYGVSLPFCYWNTNEWRGNISAAGLTIELWYDRLMIYPWWANWVFGRGLHLLARLKKA
jgi:SAM-dependent methyltransferase